MGKTRTLPKELLADQASKVVHLGAHLVLRLVSLETEKMEKTEKNRNPFSVPPYPERTSTILLRYRRVIRRNGLR